LSPDSADEAAPSTRPEPSTYRPAETVFAGFWIRVAAAIIDWLVVTVATGILVSVTFGPPGFFLGFVGTWLYEALMTASEKQATLGKLLMGIIVTDEAGNQLTFGRATGRHFAKYLSGLILFVGYIMVAFTDRKQGLHDMIAGTVVVYDHK